MNNRRIRSLIRHDYKALRDMTRCVSCDAKFLSDDQRSNVYDDSGCIGAIHDGYGCLVRFGVLVDTLEAASTDASDNSTKLETTRA